MESIPSTYQPDSEAVARSARETQKISIKELRRAREVYEMWRGQTQLPNFMDNLKCRWNLFKKNS